MWYVLQVKSGKEEAVASCLSEKNVLAYVPRENRLIRKGGSWGNREYTLFPGYVFVNLDYTAKNYYMVKATGTEHPGHEKPDYPKRAAACEYLP